MHYRRQVGGNITLPKYMLKEIGSSPGDDVWAFTHGRMIFLRLAKACSAFADQPHRELLVRKDGKLSLPGELLDEAMTWMKVGIDANTTMDMIIVE
jgi:bifunctional DNA-binding transcriptional regulator/antitoxin component of YhaV-PrlF toxin-antitoxin module